MVSAKMGCAMVAVVVVAWLAVLAGGFWLACEIVKSVFFGG